MNLITVIGHTGQGKSNYINNILLGNTVNKNGVTGLDYYTISAKSKRQYIFDVNNEYQFPVDTQLLPIMRNVSLDEKYFFSTCSKLRNTNIVFEDATGFLRGRQAPDWIRLIQKKRHDKNNYIVLFHSIENVPPEIMRLSNYIVLFKTADNLNAIEKKFNNPRINAAFLRLQKAKKYSREIIQTIL